MTLPGEHLGGSVLRGNRGQGLLGLLAGGYFLSKGREAYYNIKDNDPNIGVARAGWQVITQLATGKWDELKVDISNRDPYPRETTRATLREADDVLEGYRWLRPVGMHSDEKSLDRLRTIIGMNGYEKDRDNVPQLVLLGAVNARLGRKKAHQFLDQAVIWGEYAKKEALKRETPDDEGTTAVGQRRDSTAAEECILHAMYEQHALHRGKPQGNDILVGAYQRYRAQHPRVATVHGGDLESLLKATVQQPLNYHLRLELLERTKEERIEPKRRVFQPYELRLKAPNPLYLTTEDRRSYARISHAELSTILDIDPTLKDEDRAMLTSLRDRFAAAMQRAAPRTIGATAAQDGAYGTTDNQVPTTVPYPAATMHQAIPSRYEHNYGVVPGMVAEIPRAGGQGVYKLFTPVRLGAPAAAAAAALRAYVTRETGPASMAQGTAPPAGAAKPVSAAKPASAASTPAGPASGASIDDFFETEFQPYVEQQQASRVDDAHRYDGLVKNMAPEKRGPLLALFRELDLYPARG